MINGKSPQEAINFTVATSALKHSLEGNYNRASLAEVKKLASGNGIERVRRWRMIESKEDLKQFLETERLLFLHRNYGMRQIERKRPKLIGEYEWKYVRSLRWTEYLKNSGGGYTDLVVCLLHVIRYKILSVLFCVKIPLNIFDEGLLVLHLHGLIISEKVRVGKFCCLFQNTTIGISVGTDDHGNCPLLGDGITICTGAVVVGDIKVADGVTIAANAVVVKNIEKSGCVFGGVPAKEIKESAGFSMLDYWQKINTMAN